MKNAIRFVLFLGIGCVLIFFSIRKLEFNALVQTIQSAQYWVVLPVFSISVAGYWFRSIRWKIILRAMGHTVSTGHLFSALSIGYAVNIATPRLGELVRCVVLQKTDTIAVEHSLVSVVVERVIDFLCLFLVLLMAAGLSFDSVQFFISQNILTPLLQQWLELPLAWIVLVLFVVAVASYVAVVKMKGNNRFGALLLSILESVKQIINLQQKGAFIGYTILIWTCYFMMTYLWFYIFPETGVLGFKEAMVIMAIGSIGRSVPVQGGGMGAYHFLVSNAFTLFGITLLMGNAMAFIIHGAQLILTFVLGMASWLWMLLLIKRQKK